MLLPECIKTRCVHGFTLAEILVAVTILAVGILGVLGTFSVSLRAGTQASRLETAAAIADRELELVVAAHKEITSDSGGSSGQYRYKVRVTELPQNLLLASVEVRWFERGRSETFRLSRVFVAPHDGERN